MTTSVTIKNNGPYDIQVHVMSRNAENELPDSITPLKADVETTLHIWADRYLTIIEPPPKAA